MFLFFKDCPYTSTIKVDAAVTEVALYCTGEWEEGKPRPTAPDYVYEIVKNNLIKGTDWDWYDGSPEECAKQLSDAVCATAQADQIIAWQADVNIWLNDIVRPVRNNKLEKADKYQGCLLWAELSVEQQTELTAWRTALKDITTTLTEYIAEIIWPQLSFDVGI